MAYRELITVAGGIKGQLEACESALDRHENLPDLAENLANALEAAMSLCDQIVTAGEAEPEETPQPVTPPDNGTTPAPASLENSPNIFE